MALKDKLAAMRTKAITAVGRHRGAIDSGITKIGEAADAKTGRRHQGRIRKGVDRARAGLDRIDPDEPQAGQPAIK